MSNFRFFTPREGFSNRKTTKAVDFLHHYIRGFPIFKGAFGRGKDERFTSFFRVFFLRGGLRFFIEGREVFFGIFFGGFAFLRRPFGEGNICTNIYIYIREGFFNFFIFREGGRNF